MKYVAPSFPKMMYTYYMIICRRYLLEELHLSQVEVNTGEGIVRLKQISFDCNVLNDEMINLLVEKECRSSSTSKFPPFRIAAVTIHELTAHISYSTILTESCHFIATGVEIIVIPNDRTSPTTASQLNAQDNVKSPDNNKKDFSNDNNNNNPHPGENNFSGKCFFACNRKCCE